MALIYNKIINKPNMEKIQNVLNLSNEADETAIVAEIEKNKAELETVKAEKAELEARLAEIDKAAKEAEENAKKELEAKAIELVENAIKEKKIAEDEKDSTVALAIANFGAVENMLSKIKNVTESVKVFDVKNIQTSKGNEDRSAWTIRDWEKKDAKGLANIKNETPEIYNQMFNDYYKK